MTDHVGDANKMVQPNPGSMEARALGCTCPRMDNRSGLGCYTAPDGSPLFWQTEGCPVHAPSRGEEGR